MALADLDNDGDPDVIVNQVNGPALVYRNDCAASRLSVRLKGKSPNTRGIGARIAVLGGSTSIQTQEMLCAGRYLSCDDTMCCFATGTSTNLTIQVAWRSGSVSVVSNALPDHLYIVDEAAAAPPAHGAKSASLASINSTQEPAPIQTP